MTSQRQIEANRRNASRSTGPRTSDGKRQSRRNALRHGLTAETVIASLEDAEDYEAFQAAIVSDYDAESAVEREMMLRLASILWRLRRATGIETALFTFAARETEQFADEPASETPVEVARLLEHCSSNGETSLDKEERSENGESWNATGEPVADSYLRLVALPTFPLDRLTRYENILWRQARQIMVTLETFRRRKPLLHRASFPLTFRARLR
jgi:hypothetical protein